MNPLKVGDVVLPIKNEKWYWGDVQDQFRKGEIIEDLRGKSHVYDFKVKWGKDGGTYSYYECNLKLANELFQEEFEV